LIELGLSRVAALFVAFVFTVHPMACESVCWATERKNVLVGLFGFGALWAAAALEGHRARVPIVAALFLLASLSKASALGLVPVLLCFELFGGRAGLRGEAPVAWKNAGAWRPIFLRGLPIVGIAIFIVAMNFIGHGTTTVVAPPGGSLFTAVL